MSDTTHTPGLWHVDHIGTDLRIWSGQRLHSVLVARVYSGEPHPPEMSLAIRQAQAEANARLIAAAPELLEALMDAQRVLAAVPDLAGGVLADVRAAIAKATRAAAAQGTKE